MNFADGTHLETDLILFSARIFALKDRHLAKQSAVLRWASVVGITINYSLVRQAD